MTKVKIVPLYSEPLTCSLNSELLLLLAMLLSSSFGEAILLGEKQLNHLPFCALSTELVTKFRQGSVMIPKDMQGIASTSLLVV